MKWEALEDWLFETRATGGAFTNEELQRALHVDGAEATKLIRSQLDAQRRPESRTLYVIHREGRTSNAVWVVGIRAADARATSGQFFDDIRTRFFRAVEPDLTRIGKDNPRARRRCERIVEMVSDHALAMLRVAVEGIEDD